MNCSPPGSYVLGIFWARMLGWVVISFSSRFVGLSNSGGFSAAWWVSTHNNCSRVNCIMNNHKLILHKIYHILSFWGASLVTQIVKHLPAMQETWVQSLAWEDPLEKEMATQSNILA